MLKKVWSQRKNKKKQKTYTTHQILTGRFDCWSDEKKTLSIVMLHDD